MRTHKQTAEDREAFRASGQKKHTWTLQERCVVFYILSPTKLNRTPADAETVFNHIFDKSTRGGIDFKAYVLRDDFNNRNASGRSQMYQRCIEIHQSKFTTEDLSAHQFAVQAIRDACATLGLTWGTGFLTLGLPVNSNSASGSKTQKRAVPKAPKRKAQNKRAKTSRYTSGTYADDEYESDESNSGPGESSSLFSFNDDSEAFDGDDGPFLPATTTQRASYTPAPRLHTHNDPATGRPWPLGWRPTPDDYVDPPILLRTNQAALQAQVNAVSGVHTRRSLQSALKSNARDVEDETQHDASIYSAEEDPESSPSIQDTSDDDESSADEGDEELENNDADHQHETRGARMQRQLLNAYSLTGQRYVPEVPLDGGLQQDGEVEEDDDDVSSPSNEEYDVDELDQAEEAIDDDEDADGETDSLYAAQQNGSPDVHEDDPASIVSLEGGTNQQDSRSAGKQTSHQATPEQDDHAPNDPLYGQTGQVPNQSRSAFNAPSPSGAPSGSPPSNNGSTAVEQPPAFEQARRSEEANDAALAHQLLQVRGAIVRMDHDDRVRLLHGAFPNVAMIGVDSLLVNANGDFERVWALLGQLSQPLFPLEHSFTSHDSPMSPSYLEPLPMFHARDVQPSQNGYIVSAGAQHIHANMDIYRRGGLLLRSWNAGTQRIEEFLTCNTAFCQACGLSNNDPLYDFQGLPFVHFMALDWSNPMDNAGAFLPLPHIGAANLPPFYRPPRTSCMDHNVLLADNTVRKAMVCAGECNVCMPPFDANAAPMG